LDGSKARDLNQSADCSSAVKVDTRHNEEAQMKFATLRMFTLAGALVGAGASALAQDKAYLGKREDIGKKEYAAHCAICHGMDGKGHGAYKELLNTAPADLTTLAKKNNGVFATDQIAKAIDGREAIATHGPREMPIWGTELSIRAPGSGTDRANSADEDEYAQSRILAIIDYLIVIQGK
jgi:mono/diheme cytochrome c family protein